MFPKDFQRPRPPQIAKPLLQWFDANQRALPWRLTREPYRVWLSEIMLQQTQVITVIPYYERFLATFPTVQALAAAPLDEVLRLWEGLGYYSRARNLHRAAQVIVEQHEGVFPQTPREALRLPGIGGYSAGAILSIAYGVALPALDGNALRVLSRVFWLPGGGRRGEEKKEAERIGQEAVSAKRPGDYNQALMELGATVCTPKAPHCPACPVRKLCVAHQRGQADAIPVVKRAVSEAVEVVAAVVWRGGKVLLAKRPAQGVWAGLWEFPNLVAESSEGEVLAAHLRECFGLEVEVGEPLATLRHGIMNQRITLTAYHCRALGGRLRCGAHEEAQWVRVADLHEYALPAPHRKIAQRLVN